MRDTETDLLAEDDSLAENVQREALHPLIVRIVDLVTPQEAADFLAAAGHAAGYAPD